MLVKSGHGHWKLLAMIGSVKLLEIDGRHGRNLLGAIPKSATSAQAMMKKGEEAALLRPDPLCYHDAAHSSPERELGSE